MSKQCKAPSPFDCAQSCGELQAVYGRNHLSLRLVNRLGVPAATESEPRTGEPGSRTSS